MKLPPCATTRCFIPAIHPKQYPEDLVTIRFQAQKTPHLSWKDIGLILTTANWPAIFRTRLMSHPEGDRLVASFRLRKDPLGGPPHKQSRKDGRGKGTRRVTRDERARV